MVLVFTAQGASLEKNCPDPLVNLKRRIEHGLGLSTTFAFQCLEWKTDGLTGSLFFFWRWKFSDTQKNEPFFWSYFPLDEYFGGMKHDVGMWTWNLFRFWKWHFFSCEATPLKINGWNLKIGQLKRKVTFQTSVVVFHVNFSRVY